MNHLVEDLIGPAAACQMLGIDDRSLLQGINDGIVPAYRIGEAIRFRPSELRHPALSGLAENYLVSDGNPPPQKLNGEPGLAENYLVSDGNPPPQKLNGEPGLAENYLVSDGNFAA